MCSQPPGHLVSKLRLKAGQHGGRGNLAAQNATAAGQEVATEAACVDTHAVGTGRSWPLGGRDLNARDQPSFMSLHLAFCKDSK